jgi:hypothetical protein
MQAYNSRQVLERGNSTHDRQVYVHLRPRSGKDCVTTNSCVKAVAKTNTGMISTGFFRPQVFTWYSFEQAVPLDYGISSFSVELVQDGTSVIENNGGGGFPFQDIVLPQLQLSCTGGVFESTSVAHLNATVAVGVSLNHPR